MDFLGLNAVVLVLLAPLIAWRSRDLGHAIERLMSGAGIYTTWIAATTACAELVCPHAEYRDILLDLAAVTAWVGLFQFAGRFRSRVALESLGLVYGFFLLTQLMRWAELEIDQPPWVTVFKQLIVVLLVTRWTCGWRAERSTIAPRDVLLLATWIALAAGVVELLLRIGRATWLGELTIPLFRRVGGDQCWVMFAVNLIVCWALGLLLAIGARCWPHLFFRRWIMVLLASLLVLAMMAPLELLVGEWTVPAGLAVLWLGQAFLRESAWAGGLAFVRRSLPLFAVAIAGWCGVMAWVATRPAPSSRASSLATEPSDTNVLLITLSSVGAKSLSLYGYPRDTTPQLERWADRGIVFDQAWSVASWSLPAHATLLTGQYPSELGVDWSTPLDGAVHTLAERLAEAGYDTLGLVSNGWYLEPAGGLGRGFDRYDELRPWWRDWAYSTVLARLAVAPLMPLPRTNAAELNDEFLGWLDRRSSKAPFFVMLNYFDAHTPYTVPKPEFDRFSPLPEVDRNRVRRAWSRGMPEGWNLEGNDQVEHARDTYDAAIAYLDDQVGRLLDELERRGILANTLVILTSDNGEQFGEHGEFGHGFGLYRQVLQVPLLILPPGGANEPARVSTPVSLLDVPRTIADVANQELPESFRGQSLARFWRPDAEDVPAAPILSQEPRGHEPNRLNSLGPIQSLVWQGWHYLRYADDRESLFDLSADPEETNDLAESEVAREVLPELRDKLDELLDSAGPSPNVRYEASAPAEKN